MDAKEIEELVTAYIEQSIQGLDKENPKFDFKASWYDLKEPKDINEFLKDTTSVVNTFGPDGYIVIGFDDRKKEFTQATFKDCKLRDSSEIINLINGRVDSLFIVNTLDIEIRGNKLSIIHIPPSINKPHIIKKYVTYENGQIKRDEENKIWVRKNSRTNSATKYDIDLMYYDRKNLEPDYNLHSNFHLKATNISANRSNSLQLTTYMTIENSGRRPVAISEMKIKIEIGTFPSLEKFNLISDARYVGQNLLIRSGEILNERIEFFSREILSFSDNQARNQKQHYYELEKKNLQYSSLEITLSNGTIIYSDLKMIE